MCWSQYATTAVTDARNRKTQYTSTLGEDSGYESPVTVISCGKRTAGGWYCLSDAAVHLVRSPSPRPSFHPPRLTYLLPWLLT